MGLSPVLPASVTYAVPIQKRREYEDADTPWFVYRSIYTYVCMYIYIEKVDARLQNIHIFRGRHSLSSSSGDLK